MTTEEQDTRSNDPARFAALATNARVPERRVWEIIGSGLALLALAIGLPALLLVLSGPPPIPTSLPSVRDFAQQLSFEDVLTVLVAVVWLAWVYFMVCVVVEVIAARRGGIGRTVPLAGPLQKLAQVLVGILLLSGLMAGTAQAAVSEAGAATQVTSSAMTPAAEGSGILSGSLEAEAGIVDAQVAARSVDDQAGHKVYTVKAPKDGYHDNLWDIAEKHLGDGFRYKEIYQLNKDHLQPDGRKLELARLIQPGWSLVMPEDAVGVPRLGAPEAPTQQAPTGSDAAGGGTSAADPAVHATAAHTGELATGWMAGAGLLAAGLVGALAVRRRRQIGGRPDDDALEVENDLLVAATRARSSWLDLALRRLALECRRQGTTPPPAYAVLLDEDSVELLIAPPTLEAVGGWTAIEKGRRWRLERAEADVEAAPNEVAPYPALVSLGVDPEGRDVLVDLEAAGGVISLVGDPTVAAEVAAAIAVQGATAPWSDAVRVIASGLPPGMSEVGDERIRVTDDLRAELPELEEQIDGLREDVLSGRMRRRGVLPSHLVVCGQPPEAEVAERLGSLAGTGRQSFSVVVAGEHKAARWRLQVDQHGALAVPQLDLTVEANRISPLQVAAVGELFAATREPEGPEDDRVQIPLPLRQHDDAAWTTASRRVGVLGLVTVQGVGDLPADRAAVATELATYLAMHPEGVHPNVLGGVLWPRGVTADVREATIDRARAWLGTAVDGTHVLRSDAGGRLSLSDDVVCDWDCARTLLIGARHAGSTREEADLLRRALKLVRGEVFGGVPEGRYGWTVRDDTTRTMVRVVVDGAHRLAVLLGPDDPGGAAQAAEAGLRMCPGSQLLWRELMRARYANLGVAGVQQTLDQMSVALQGIALEPETEALAEELLPDVGDLASGS